MKLVMMTSVGHRGDAKHLEELGFAAYLLKPLRRAVQEVVEGVRDFIEIPVVGRIVAGEPVPVAG